MSLGVEIDEVLHVVRILHVVARCGSAGWVSVAPRLERRRGGVARRPELVAVVAAEVEKPRRLQPAARAVDGQGRVGDVDVSGLPGCGQVRFGFYQRMGNGPGVAPPTADILGAVKAGFLARLWPLAILPAVLLLGSCEAPGGVSPIFPTPVSPNGQDIYNTYLGISVPAIVIFLGVEAALLWVIIRYRRSRLPVGYVPPQVYGNTRLEVLWTVIPLIIVLAIAGYSFNELLKDFQ